MFTTLELFFFFLKQELHCLLKGLWISRCYLCPGYEITKNNGPYSNEEGQWKKMVY